jgi:hypothetical protein
MSLYLRNLRSTLSFSKLLLISPARLEILEQKINEILELRLKNSNQVFLDIFMNSKSNFGGITLIFEGYKPPINIQHGKVFKF